MKTIKLFHPEETFIYNIEKCICKVVYQGNKKCLLVEIHTNDDLEHVEADSIQNKFPQLSLFVDDFPVDSESVDELNGKTILIPLGFVEEEDEDGDIHEVYYTTLSVSEEDYETIENKLSFHLDVNNVLNLVWNGKVQDFANKSSYDIPFEVNCSFEDAEITIDDFD